MGKNNISLIQATGIHTIDKVLVLGKHCVGLAVADDTVGILSGASSLSGNNGSQSQCFAHTWRWH